MEDVLAVYQRPYDPNRPVVCLDEINKTLHETPRGTLPMQPGQVARQDYQFTRNGTVNLFLKVEPLRGWRKVRVTDRRTSLDFAEEVRSLVDEDYPEASVIVLITDNLNTHTPACLYEAFPPAEARRIAAKLEWHYTPEHGSWLNVAECELSVLARQCLARRMPDKSTIISEVMAWQQKRNAAQVTIQWQFTTADARIKLRRLYPVINVQNST
jgi:hypothetical protein